MGDRWKASTGACRSIRDVHRRRDNRAANRLILQIECALPATLWQRRRHATPIRFVPDHACRARRHRGATRAARRCREARGSSGSARCRATEGDSEIVPGGKLTIKMDAKWLGPCAADQKPGDMMMGNGMKVNILERRQGLPQGAAPPR